MLWAIQNSMKYSLPSLVIIFFMVLLGCDSKSDQKSTVNPLFKELEGEWIRLDEKPKAMDFYYPVGFSFSNDTMEFFQGIHQRVIDTNSGKKRIKYHGNKTSFKINNDSIFYIDPVDGSWKFWNIINQIKQDTIIVTGADSVIDKYARLNYDLDTLLDFDQIVLSRTGCYGICPILDISININGEFHFQGEGFTDTLGFFKGKLPKTITNEIFRKFQKADIKNLDTTYNIYHTDDEVVSTTFLKDNQIIRTIHDYGKAGPPELVWAYVLLSNSYNTKTKEKIIIDDPFYPKMNLFRFKKDSLILTLEKSESFYLWTELKKNKVSNLNFEADKELGFERNSVYWGQDPNENRKHKIMIDIIITDGQRFEFKFQNDSSVYYDLGYNFISKQLKSEFIKPTQYEHL